MRMKHLDCTTEEKRRQICQDYEVHVEACISLTKGRTVPSDANHRIICNKYYQFICKKGGESKVIWCGATAARHLCKLIGEPMPHYLNPFEMEIDKKGYTGGVSGKDSLNWNPLRRQLYYAIQLFIYSRQEVLEPGTTVFDVLGKVSNVDFIHLPPKDIWIKSIATIFNRFATDLSSVIDNVKEGGELRCFDFDDLISAYGRLCPNEPNVFM